MLKNNYYKISLNVILTLVFGLSFLVASKVEAASLYLTSSSNKVTVGSLVTINLLVSTQGKNINNAEVSLRYPNDLIEVISVKGSLFSLWVENPSFSNTSGQISFNGGLPDPGYNGSGAKILTIVARAKKVGTASFLFGDAAVRENDGLGTDILSGQSPVSFAIISTSDPEVKPITPIATVVPVNEGVDSPVTISSPTYARQDAWYAATSGVINWNLPSKASAVQTLIDHNPYSTPSIKYDKPILSKNISNLSDGVWYFHLRYLLNNNWSKISHYKIQIDTSSPTDFSILPEKNSNNSTIGFKLAAKDVLSGVDYYNVSVDGQPNTKILATNAPNIIPLDLSGAFHKIVATVYDESGNKAELNTELNTEVNTSKLSTPTLDTLPGEITTGSKLTISGESIYPNTALKLAINSDIFDLSSDKFGKFSFNSDSFANEGEYKISVYAPGANNNNSDPAIATLIAKKPNQTTISALTPAASPIKINYSWLFNILKILLALVLLYGWYKYIAIKVKTILVSKRAKRLSVEILLKNANQELKALEKAQKSKKTTRSEVKSLSSLKKIINEIEAIYQHKR